MTPPRTIGTLLVANRGEIARRVFRTCRERGIATVAVFSDADADAPYVREADAAVRLPGERPADTYLRGDLVVAAALRAGADAVHPGYGFLSEDAAFARAVVAAGLVWVGPPPEAVEAMGDKLRAKALVAAAGVPVLPGAHVVPGELDGVDLPPFPLLVKASAGGGGRGMRVVRDAAALPGAVDAAAQEALAAFGDGTVFVERYLERPRHVEVQVAADAAGGVVVLGERDCSLQRRHQKVVEEAPSPAVDPALRARLAAAAEAATRSVGYLGVGTVEMVLEGETLAFLEMNTRLQVEHPVTEAVTGLDLVALQLDLATGAPVPPAPQVQGHAVEARVYAEDVPAGFLPSTGTVALWEPPAGVRVDSGVETGSVVSPHYDAMLAKVVASGRTRAEATARLADALLRLRVHGVTTNRDLLVRVLRSPEWAQADIDTGWLDRADAAALGAPLVTDVRPHLAAAALAGAARRQRDALLPGAPAGWRNVRSQPQRTVLDGVLVEHDRTRDGLLLRVDGAALDARLWSCTDELVDLEVDGVRRRYRVARGPGDDTTGAAVTVDGPSGSTRHAEAPRHPLPEAAVAAGSLVAPMPGRVLRVAVSAGQRVGAGDVLVVLEAMKMEHAVRAPSDGTVTALPVGLGEQVEAGGVLVVLEAD